MSEQTLVDSAQAKRACNHRFGLALWRAVGGAIFFALPLFLTMEMWWLGFYMDRVRLALLMVVLIPVLMPLASHFGFSHHTGLAASFRQTMVAYAVGAVTAGVILFLIGILQGPIFADEFFGKLMVQAVPASIGAIVGAGQFAPEAEPQEDRRARATYTTELFFMLAGALYLGISVAPTEEMIVIAFKMDFWHAVLLTVASVVIIHALVYHIDFKRRHIIPKGTPIWSYFMRFTMVSYAIALIVSAYVLWTFGRYDETGFTVSVLETVVLAFPASLGAAGARLIL